MTDVSRNEAADDEQTDELPVLSMEAIVAAGGEVPSFVSEDIDDTGDHDATALFIRGLDDDDPALSPTSRMLAAQEKNESALVQPSEPNKAGPNSVEALGRDVAELTARWSGVEELLAANASATLTLKEELANSRTELRDSHARYQELLAHVDKQPPRSNHLDQALEVANTRATELENKLSAASIQKAELERDLETAHEHSQHLEAERESATGHGTQLEEALGSATERAMRLETELDSANQRASQLEEERESATERATRLESELDSANPRAAQLEAELEVVDARATQLASELDSASSRMAQLETELNSSLERAAELEDKLAATDARAEEDTREIESAKSHADQLVSDLAQAREDLQTQIESAAEIRTATDKLIPYQEQIQSLEEYIAGRGDRWQEMENIVASQSDKIGELETELEQRITRQGHLEQRVQEEHDSAEALRDKITQLSAELDYHERNAARQDVAAQQAHINAAEAEHQSRESADLLLGNMQDEIDQLRELLDQRESELNAVNESNEDLQQALSYSDIELEQTRQVLARLERKFDLTLDHAQAAASGTQSESETTPTLVCLTSDVPERYTVDKPIMTIGRSSDCDISVLTHFVSRVHAELRTENGDTVINDLASTNGVFVNAVRTKSKTLIHGDWVTIGETQFRFLSDLTQ